MASQEWLNVSEGDIEEILKTYDLSDIHVAALATHSELDLASGLKEHNQHYRKDAPFLKKLLWATDVKRPEDFTTLAVCKKGKEKTYTEYNKVRKRGRDTVGCVDETIVLNEWKDVLKPEYQQALRDKNTIFVPSRSTVVYLGYPGIGSHNVPYLGHRKMLSSEETSGEFYSEESNQARLVKDAGIPHPKKFKSIDDVDVKALVKVSKGVGERHFERCFQIIDPEEGDPREIYEAKGKKYVVDTSNKYEKELKKKLSVKERAELEQKLDTHYRESKIEEFIPGNVYANFNFFRSPIHNETELLGIDCRVQFDDGEEALHQVESVRESLLENIYVNMGEKFVDITEKVFGRKIVGPFALQCKGDNGIFKVYDVSLRIQGSPDTRYGPNCYYLYIRPVSVGERIGMEIRYALEESDPIGGMMKILS